MKAKSLFIGSRLFGIKLHGFLTTCLQWTFITTTVFVKMVPNQIKYMAFSIKGNKTSIKLHIG